MEQATAVSMQVRGVQLHAVHVIILCTCTCKRLAAVCAVDTLAGQLPGGLQTLTHLIITHLDPKVCVGGTCICECVCICVCVCMCGSRQGPAGGTVTSGMCMVPVSYCMQS